MYGWFYRKSFVCTRSAMRVISLALHRVDLQADWLLQQSRNAKGKPIDPSNIAG